MSETLRVLLEHRSIRAFDDRPVPEALLEALVSAAQSAPSSCNLQCWSVVAVRDPATKAALNAVSGRQAQVEAAPVLLCFLADLARIEAVTRANGLEPVSLDYLEMLLVGVIDATLAAQNLATAAESLGLGTCYIGGMRNDISAVAEVLHLPPQVMPVFGLALGYPDPARPAAVKPRLPQAAVLHHDRYAAGDLAAQVAAYEARLAAFNAGQGRQVEPWGLKSAERVASIARMEGRELMAEKLAAMGLARR